MTNARTLRTSVLLAAAGVVTAMGIGLSLAQNTSAQEQPPAPTDNQPSTEQPAADQPATGQPATEQPATRPFSVPTTPGAEVNRGESSDADTTDDDGEAPDATGGDAGMPAKSGVSTKPAAADDGADDGADAADGAVVGAVEQAAPATGPATTPTAEAAAPSTQPVADNKTSPATRPSGGSSYSSSKYSSSKSGRSDDSRSSRPSSERSSESASADRPVAIAESRKMDKEFQVLLQRSLFSKSRPAPPPPPVTPRKVDDTPPVPPPAPEKQMAVRGMSIEGEDGDGECYAFIEDLPLKQMMRIKVGDKVARGKVIEVTLADLVYEYDGNRTRVAIGHTLDGAPAPTVSWSTYTPVATAPPPGSRDSGRDSGRGDSGRSDSGRSDSSRSDSSRSDSGRSDSSRSDPRTSSSGRSESGGSPAAATPAPAAPAATPAAPAATPAASEAPAGDGAESLLERMRRRREAEGGR